jgi:hypothetical protein
MLRRMRDALNNFLERNIVRKITDVERQLAAARKHPDVSLQDVKSAQKSCSGSPRGNPQRIAAG